MSILEQSKIILGKIAHEFVGKEYEDAIHAVKEGITLSVAHVLLGYDDVFKDIPLRELIGIIELALDNDKESIRKLLEKLMLVPQKERQTKAIELLNIFGAKHGKHTEEKHTPSINELIIDLNLRIVKQYPDINLNILFSILLGCESQYKSEVSSLVFFLDNIFEEKRDDFTRFVEKLREGVNLNQAIEDVLHYTGKLFTIDDLIG